MLTLKGSACITGRGRERDRGEQEGRRKKGRKESGRRETREIRMWEDYEREESRGRSLSLSLVRKRLARLKGDSMRETTSERESGSEERERDDVYGNRRSLSLIEPTNAAVDDVAVVVLFTLCFSISLQDGQQASSLSHREESGSLAPFDFPTTSGGSMDFLTQDRNSHSYTRHLLKLSCSHERERERKRSHREIQLLDS